MELLNKRKRACRDGDGVQRELKVKLRTEESYRKQLESKFQKPRAGFLLLPSHTSLAIKTADSNCAFPHHPTPTMDFSIAPLTPPPCVKKH
eukprot:superscaffoldBa00006016_g21037